VSLLSLHATYHACTVHAAIVILHQLLGASPLGLKVTMC
jgi:hypothetical protein